MRLIRPLVLALVLALLLLPVALPGLAPEAGAASYRVAYRDHRRRLSPKANRRMNRYLRQGCTIFQLSGEQYRFFLRALGHAFETFNDPRFQRLVRGRPFTHTNLSGPGVVRRITSTNLRLTVWGYERRRASCRVGRHANAFYIHQMIFLKRGYLEARRTAGDWRRLAQTLAHEMMHGLGFGHGDNANQASAAKRRSVPLTVGCLVRHWPDVAKARRVCLAAGRGGAVGPVRGTRAARGRAPPPRPPGKR